jgi:hypothetical protein
MANMVLIVQRGKLLFPVEAITELCYLRLAMDN